MALNLLAAVGAGEPAGDQAPAVSALTHRHDAEIAAEFDEHVVAVRGEEPATVTA